MGFATKSRSDLLLRRPAAERAAAVTASAFVDNRPGAVAQRELVGAIPNSPFMIAQRRLLNGIHHSGRSIAQRSQLSGLFGRAARLQEGPDSAVLAPKGAPGEVVQRIPVKVGDIYFAGEKPLYTLDGHDGFFVKRPNLVNGRTVFKQVKPTGRKHPNGKDLYEAVTPEKLVEIDERTPKDRWLRGWRRRVRGQLFRASGREIPAPFGELPAGWRGVHVWERPLLQIGRRLESSILPPGRTRLGVRAGNKRVQPRGDEGSRRSSHRQSDARVDLRARSHPIHVATVYPERAPVSGFLTRTPP